MEIGSTTFHSVVEQFQAVYDKALELFNSFESEEADVLLRITGELETEVEKFLNSSGLEASDCNNLLRHLHFLKYYLKKNNKTNCEGDAREIISYDLPAGLKKLIQKQSTETHFDEALKIAVMPLVQGGHYDSAIRKAFILVTERMRNLFGIADQIDGEELINKVFGSGGQIQVRLDTSKKTSYRNLISGFYGVYRNKFAHSDVTPTLSETKAILEMANNIIIELEDIAVKSIQNDT